jgi:hypothetical protein
VRADESRDESGRNGLQVEVKLIDGNVTGEIRLIHVAKGTQEIAQSNPIE